jgi:predicted flap endonuclease-1-like 5' DNA nuclease
MTTLISIEGVGEKYAQKLKDAGVGTSEELLKAGATPKGRKDLAAKTGISEDRLLEWVNHVDLFRIRGVGEEYADLLEAAGVDTIPELAQRKAANLYAKLVEVNQVKKLVRQVPSEQMIADWIQQAGELPRVIEY